MNWDSESIEEEDEDEGMKNIGLKIIKSNLFTF